MVQNERGAASFTPTKKEVRVEKVLAMLKVAVGGGGGAKKVLQ